MKILVTGANGYLGQGIVKQLLNRGCDIIATDRSANLIDSRAKVKTCNLFEIEDSFEYFEKPDVLLHLAWSDGFIHNSLNHFVDLPLHYSFIQSMLESGLARVAVMGSMHEIGFFEGSINEHTPCNSMSLYGIAKDALRKSTALLAKTKNIPFQWLRGFYIVGNSQYGNSIFSKITAAELEGNAEFPFTTGQNHYDFLDYDEFCNQVAVAVIQDRVTGIINICSGKPEKLSDRVERFIYENGYKIILKYGAYPDRPYDSKAVWGDNSKIQLIISRYTK